MSDFDFEKDLREIRKISKKIQKKAAVGSNNKKSLWRRFLPFFLYLNLAFLVIPPVCHPMSGPITSDFFFRINPVEGNFEFHKGVDFAAPVGTNITVSTAGVVSATGYNDRAGNYVIVSHLFGLETHYYHLDQTHTSSGSLLIPPFGSVGTVGNTGLSTGPHLHWGTKWMGIWVPPLLVSFHDSLRRWIWGWFWSG